MDPPIYSAGLNFQMPHFVGSTSSLAFGGGAEVIPGMYGQGTGAWEEYDKFWYDQSTPNRYGAPPALPAPTPAPARPFDYEFDDAPQAVVPSHQISSSSSYMFPSPNFLDPTAPLPPLPPTGLPLYSASGFDMLRMLAKVATRPNPKIQLGPVDMTCSFVVSDLRRVDAPIVYASPTFCRLTGYTEAEVLGRNCRFLQSPTGILARGEQRFHTAPDAVRHLQRALLQDKEAQASLINYRKGGAAFVNLVTIIPISAPDDEADPHSMSTGELTHCVGFQVDLAEQPNAILQKLRDGSYVVNYSAAQTTAGGAGGERRGKGVSADMLELLRTLRPAASPEKPLQHRTELHSLLLEHMDDFIHVVSLKGALLYVSPAVTRVLGHAPSALLGTSLAELCHPADVVPLMRELKDASTSAAPSAPSAQHTHPHDPAPVFIAHPPPPPPPRPIALLFRARHARGAYVWLEARGRLHVEQGKGRKAVVLVGRRADVPRVRWGALNGAAAADASAWARVSPAGLVLGGVLAGRSLGSVVCEEGARRRVGQALARAACGSASQGVRCRVVVQGAAAGAMAGVAEAEAELRFFPREEREAAGRGVPPSVVFRLTWVGEERASASGSVPCRTYPPDADVLAELSTSPPPTAPPSPTPQGAEPSPAPPATTTTTSWQYELTRLRFENERLRAEVARVERVCVGVKRAREDAV